MGALAADDGWADSTLGAIRPAKPEESDLRCAPRCPKKPDTAEEGDVRGDASARDAAEDAAPCPASSSSFGGGQQSESGSEVAMPFSETARERRHATSHAVVKWASHISLRLGRSPE